MRTIRPIPPLRPPAWLVQSAAEVGGLSVALIKSGVWRSAGPAQLVRIERALRTWGQSMAALGVIAAIRYPERPAVISGDDVMTYAELDRRCERIAAGMQAQYGIVAGSKVAVLCRNHRGFLEATLAASRIGADVLFVNTEFAPPQLQAVLERHRPDLLVHDEEFTPPADLPAVLSASAGLRPAGAGTDEDSRGPRSLHDLARSGGPAAPAPDTAGHITILTSGTTGTPKAAPRVPTAVGLAGLTGSALSRFGLRAGEPMVVCPPLFHGLGLLTSMLALFLGSPLVLRPRFDAATLLADVEATRAGAIVAVPVMLRRILDLGPDATAQHDLRSLRAVISGASQLGAPLAERFIERFGPVLCDAYGSSEVGIATIATSADLLAAPGTVGRPCLGSTIRILDDQDRTVPTGTTGRIFAGGGLVFGGYSDGSSKTVVDGRMSTGDLGHVDAAGRLFVDGREDDMIVSGGENVYPVEVEQCLAAHPAVAEAVVAGVPDDEFGQRLIAYVVLDSPATEDELLTHVKANLARYKTPRRIVVLDEFPRNATGKVLRGKLTPP
ncbi:AMP-binding protein [Kribbella sp. VKM Ac-2566]|uniref:AMP-binding protein n=1 Tax=Kribbella sp. VKM Ac-2566 TaxID=2512218 RepID=UPI0010E44E32|nr:AMP-binding protein [Kribbella sp. VKM Ac-2566]TDW92041.1 fatty-acyl-CoA synthase [Kribbella sp. VKM Ac-2566]